MVESWEEEFTDARQIALSTHPFAIPLLNLDNHRTGSWSRTMKHDANASMFYTGARLSVILFHKTRNNRYSRQIVQSGVARKSGCNQIRISRIIFSRMRLWTDCHQPWNYSRQRKNESWKARSHESDFFASLGPIMLGGGGSLFRLWRRLAAGPAAH